MEIASLILLRRLVTMDESRPLVEDCALYIGADKPIAAVDRRDGVAG